MSVAVVQSAISLEGAASLAWPSAVTAGNLLIVALGNANGQLGNPATIADTLGSAWTQAQFDHSTDNDSVALFYAVAATSGPNTLTVTGSGFGGFASLLAVAEVSGSFTGVDSAGGGGTSNPNLTIAASTDFVITAAYYQENAAAGVTSPEVLLGFRRSGLDRGLALAFYASPATGSFVSSLTTGYVSGDSSIPAVVSVAFFGTPPPVANGIAQCSGEVDGVELLIGGGPRGAVQCSGSIGPVAFGSRASSTVECSGSAHAVLSALATAQGRVQCFGSIAGGITFYAVVNGLVECRGFATTPLKGTSLACLQPGSTPVLPVQGNACY
jgi:hypothetical protein